MMCKICQLTFNCTWLLPLSIVILTIYAYLAFIKLKRDKSRANLKGNYMNLAVIAQASSAGTTTNIIMNLAPIALVFVVFYFLLIRPQQQRLKAHQAMIAAVARGDTVVTSGGIVGKVTKVDETEVAVEIAQNVVIKVIKHTIQEVRGKTVPAPANDVKK